MATTIRRTKLFVLMMVMGSAAAMSGCKSDKPAAAATSASSTSSPVAPGITAPVPTTSPTPAPGTGNQAPKISGAPGSNIAIGQQYSFSPSASDADGDTLGFSIANRPAWAQFDTTTGRLTGKPTSANVGTFANIRISVSDGKMTTALPAFAVSVTSTTAAPAPTGSATLAWTAPTENVDGSPLENLAGFQIRYGTSADALTQTIKVEDAAAVSYVVHDLAPATYFFAVQSINSDGAESELSSVASKTII